MHPHPVWSEGGDPEPSRPLADDMDCDVAIIGGGISGVSAAFHLWQMGVPRIALIEQTSIASGSTGWSGGFLVPNTFLDLKELIDGWGPDQGKLMYDSIAEAVANLGDVAAEFAPDCGFVRAGAFYTVAEPSHIKKARGEYETLAQYDIPARWHEPHSKEIPITNPYGALETFDDCAVNPVKLVRGIARSLTDRGVTIATGTTVTALRKMPGHCLLKTNHGKTIRAPQVVLATNNWPAARALVPKNIRSRSVSVSSHILVTKPVPGIAAVWKGQLVWDTYFIYHYLRLLPDERILIGGEDSLFVTPAHGRTTVGNRRRNRHLLAYLRKLFPQFAIEADYGWSGTIALPIDEIPLIKTTGPVTLLLSEGIPPCWMLGRMAAERIVKGGSPYDGLYDADRSYGFLEDLFIKLPLPHPLKRTILKTGVVVEKIRDELDKWYRH